MCLLHFALLLAIFSRGGFMSSLYRGSQAEPRGTWEPGTQQQHDINARWIKGRVQISQSRGETAIIQA